MRIELGRPGHDLPDGLVLEVQEGVAGAAERWSQALHHCVAYGFQTPEWAGHWERTIGHAERVRTFVVSLCDEHSRVLMLWPLAIHREGRARVLRFLGGVVTDYNAPIVDPAFAERLTAAGVNALWRRVVRALPKTDAVRLRRMPADIDGLPNPMCRLPGATHTENAYSATLPETVEAFQAVRSSKIFADARRQLRRLGEVGPVKMVEHAAGDDALAVTALMSRQKSRRWAESAGRDLFAEPGYLDFYQGLSVGPAASDMTAVSSMRVGDTIVATHWGIIFRGRYYWLMPGYEVGEWGRYSCGRLLMQHMIEWSIAHKLQVFDLTVGDEDYKKNWADRTLELYEWQSARSLRGSLPIQRERLRRWARAQPWLRTLVNRLRNRA